MESSGSWASPQAAPGYPRGATSDADVEPLRQGPEIQTLAFSSSRGDQRDPSDQKLTCRDVLRQDQRARLFRYRTGCAAAEDQHRETRQASTAGGRWNPHRQVWECGTIAPSRSAWRTGSCRTPGPSAARASDRRCRAGAAHASTRRCRPASEGGGRALQSNYSSAHNWRGLRVLHPSASDEPTR